MKIRFLPIVVAALLLSATPSEARSRRHPHIAPRRAEAPRASAGSDEGGPLARSRGLSQGESAAVGAVLAEIAGSQASAADAAAANIPARRFSPDYYRAYAHRTQAAGTKQRVAVTPPGPKPQAVAAVPPVPATTPVVAVKKVAVAPAPIKPPKIVPPPPVPAKAPRVVRPQVAAAPPTTEIRTAFAPRKAVVKTPAASPQTTAAVPVRAAFRDQNQR